MKRINKTEKNLQKVWNDLDAVCGLLDNTFNDLNSMAISDKLKDEIAAIDITAIISLKNKVEELMEQSKQ